MLLLCVDIHNENRSYTDFHDVDEDTRTNIDQGGSWGYGWSNGSAPGVFLRSMMNSFNTAGPTVASSNTGIDHLSYG